MGQHDLVTTVAKLATNGEGLAFIDGKALFLPFTIPGERVRCRIVSERTDFVRGELIELLEPSPHRVEPPCPLFGECGGCNLQHIEYGHQLALKSANFPESAPVESEPYGYRNRARFHFAPDGGIGFRKALSDETIRVRSCPILSDSINRWLKPLNRRSRPDRELMARIGRREEFNVFGQEERFYLQGRDAFAFAHVAGREYRFPVGHFFQSNLKSAELLIQSALEGLSGLSAADLYCGAGLFSAPLAERFETIDCVESDTVSLESARFNVPSRKARFHPVEVEQWVENSRHSSEPYDWILADPPRSGLSAPVRSWLKTHPPRSGLVYISCDQATFLRDRNDFLKAGWIARSVRLFDFYPQTGRVELLARLLPPGSGGAS